MKVKDSELNANYDANGDLSTLIDLKSMVIKEHS